MRKIFLTLLFSIFCSNAFATKLVGITTDYRANADGKNDFAKTSFYALRDNYVSSFQKTCKKYDVTLMIVPLDKSMVKSYAKLLDGLVFSGNYYDIDPKFYNQKVLNSEVKIDGNKSEFEMLLFKEFYKTKKPLFAICGGYQMINVVLGGELYQDLPAQVKESKISHRMDGRTCAHEINIVEKEGHFFDAMNLAKKYEKKICVNSVHHQAISKLAPSLETTATAPDEIIEGYKDKTHPFLIGMQWHPEYQLTKFDTAMIDEFCRAVAEKN